MAARIVVTEFVSLDGVMEAPGGEPDFKYPGWTFEFDRGDDGNQFKLDETRRAAALLIGGRTYESFAGAWPKREGEFADKFNSMPKVVVLTRLKDPEWNNISGSGPEGRAVAGAHLGLSSIAAASSPAAKVLAPPPSRAPRRAAPRRCFSLDARVVRGGPDRRRSRPAPRRPRRARTLLLAAQ
jgi:RibD C-terminal domain